MPTTVPSSSDHGAHAGEVGATSLAFPAISTGIFGYPIHAVADIAVATVRTTSTSVAVVRFVCFDTETWDAYEAALAAS